MYENAQNTAAWIGGAISTDVTNDYYTKASQAKKLQQSFGQTSGLGKVKDVLDGSLKADIESLYKRSVNIQLQVNQLFELLFGPIVEPTNAGTAACVPSLESTVRDSYDVLADIDCRLTTLLTRAGGR